MHVSGEVQSQFVPLIAVIVPPVPMVSTTSMGPSVVSYPTFLTSTAKV